MKVTTIAHTALAGGFHFNNPTDYRSHLVSGGLSDPVDTTELDELGEFAGRSCYKSWNRPNPKTATNEGYLANILGQGHESVLEHSSVSFWVEGVSRALLTELERHRHISFSVESQRYVATGGAHPEPVIPPALRGTKHEASLRFEYGMAIGIYNGVYEQLVTAGLKKKEAREAARAFLPNATPVDFVVTGNLRAWRDVLGKRWHVAADAEIREFAGLVLAELRELAPNSVQDIPNVPYGTEEAA